MKSDIHGRHKLTQNVLTNWGAQLVRIISGFIIPRMIDQQISQEALGVWDFAWSIVSYLSLVQMGIVGSINRFVAFYRAQEDYNAINRAVSSVAVVMRGMGLFVLILSLVFSWLIVSLFQQRIGIYQTQAQWLVFLIGTSVAIQISASVYGSILTGLHRWDLHNGIQALTNVLTLIGMITSLVMGFGLIGLALANLFGEIFGRVSRVFAAYRLCPWLKIKFKHFSLKTALEMISFGGKTFVTNISWMLINSTVSIMIVEYIGIAALAVYARPMGILRHLDVFINKYAMVFSPTISSLKGAEEEIEIRKIVVKSTNFGIYLLLPPIIFLIFFGGDVIRLWMGNDYAKPILIAVLSLNMLFITASIPIFKSLVSLDLHGQPGLVNFFASFVTIITTFIALEYFNFGLTGVALTACAPMAIVNGLYLPVYATNKLGLSLKNFLISIWQGPVLCALPYTACLLIGKLWFKDTPYMAILFGGCFGGIAIGICYWKTIVPTFWKDKIMRVKLIS